MGPLVLGDMTYLKIRRGKGRSGARWYVCVPVPKELQPIIRKRTVEVALNTDSKKEAQHLRYEVVAKIKRDFARALERKITSQDIASEALIYCEQRLAVLRRDPANFNEIVRDENGGPLGLNGEIALSNFPEMLEDEFYPYRVLWNLPFRTP